MDEIIVVSADKLKKIIRDCLSELGTVNNSKNEIEKIEFLNSKEVCRSLQICNATLFQWIKKGKLIPKRIGRKLLFQKDDIYFLNDEKRKKN